MTENISSLLIGILFGASLDLAGFGSAKKLNAQFLLRDFSMFKVMFGAIIISAAFYFAFVNFGFSAVSNSVIPTLDLGLLIGAFLLGVGLVLGGYCPGTAVTGAAGGRIDAFVFFLMMYPGYRLWIWLEPRVFFDLHVPLAERNLTLPDLLGAPVILILIALGFVCLLGWKCGDYFESFISQKK